MFLLTILATVVGITFSLVFRDLEGLRHLSVPLRQTLSSLTGSEAVLVGTCRRDICSVFPSLAMQVALSFCALMVSPIRSEDVPLLSFALGCGVLVEVSQSVRSASTFDLCDMIAIFVVYGVFRVSVLMFRK